MSEDKLEIKQNEKKKIHLIYDIKSKRVQIFFRKNTTIN